MTLQVDFIWFVGMLVTFFGACAAAGKILLGQTQRHLDERFEAQEKARGENHSQTQKRLDGIEVANREDATQWQRIERDFLRFQAELPLQYVRREDYVRGQAVVEAKLDAVYNKLEVIQIRGAKNG